MNHNPEKFQLNSEEFINLGNEKVAYVRKITGDEINRAFPDQINLAEDSSYWGLFAADGKPLIFSEHPSGVLEGAFYNDLQAVQPN